MMQERPDELVALSRPKTGLREPKVLEILTCSSTFPESDAPSRPSGFRAIQVDGNRRNRDGPCDRWRRSPLVRVPGLGRLALWTARRLGRARSVARVIALEGPALVHCRSAAAAVLLHEVRRRGTDLPPSIVSLTGTDLGRLARSPWWSPRIKEALLLCSAWIAEGAASAVELERLAQGSGRVRVIRRSIELDAIAPAGPRGAAQRRQDPRLQILFCGPFVRRQGISFALEAHARLARSTSGARLRLIGSGPLLREARALADHLGVSRDVEFLPRGGRAELLRALPECDVFISPNITVEDGDRESGPPPALLLAMAAAIPVVASRHGDIPEAVVHGKTGLLTEERDVDGLVAALVRLRNDVELARELGRGGRSHLEMERPSRKTAEALEDLYRATAGAGKSSAQSCGAGREH